MRLYGLRHLRDRHLAADLVQQVLLMTLQRLRAGEVREPERIASFVLGACRMTALEMRRGGWRRETLLETWGGAAEACEPPDPPWCSTPAASPGAWKRSRSASAPLS